jgi:hypothetical protein
MTTSDVLLQPHKADRDSCFVCTRQASTFEHVIPKWLLHRFDLWDQALTLPNGTSIPACARCNNEVFGALEWRVQSEAASESDIWKWANKIHYGLSHKDRFLAWDRANSSCRIGDVVQRDDPLELSRHFLQCVAGDFRTDPDPFGSVFTFRFASPQGFRFAHFIASSSLCLCTGTSGYVVFVEDGQALKRDVGLRPALRAVPDPPRVEDMLFFYAQCLEQATRHALGVNFLMTRGLLIRTGRTVVHSVEPPDKQRFRFLCRTLGLDWRDSDEA